MRYALQPVRRWHDVAFRSVRLSFGALVYWEAETRDLEERLEVIREKPDCDLRPKGSSEGLDTNRESSQELTNKDHILRLRGAGMTDRMPRTRSCPTRAT